MVKNTKEIANDGPVVAHINRRFFETTETFIYSYLSHFHRVHPICLSSLPMTNEEIFPFSPADTYIVGLKRYSSKWLIFGGWRRLTGRRILEEKILRRRGVRLIHAHYGPNGWWALPHKRALKLGLVTTFYGWDLAPKIAWGEGNWKKRRKELFEEGDLFMVEGPFMRETLISLGCPPEKVEIQRIAVRLDKLSFRIRRPKSCAKIRIIFAGRFMEKKGLIYALQAVHELSKDRRDFEFRIIGAGELIEEFKTYIKDNNLAECVKLLGILNYQEYASEMNEADIFLHPSVVAANGDTEGGAPTVILEAQAMGMPVVSTYHADIPYITVPGKSAILVKERDVKGLTKALSELLDHPERWEEMGRIGRAHIEKYHNIEHEVVALEDKYFRLIKGH
jgi:colanic acid/amylovoran biosynthesis glycosyltransferase